MDFSLYINIGRIPVIPQHPFQARFRNDLMQAGRNADYTPSEPVILRGKYLCLHRIVQFELQWFPKLPSPRGHIATFFQFKAKTKANGAMPLLV